MQNKILDWPPYSPAKKLGWCLPLANETIRKAPLCEWDEKIAQDMLVRPMGKNGIYTLPVGHGFGPAADSAKCFEIWIELSNVIEKSKSRGVNHSAILGGKVSLTDAIPTDVIEIHEIWSKILDLHSVVGNIKQTSL